MTTADPTEDLDARVRRGDTAAAAEICRRVRPALERFARRYLADAHGAEDIAQDAITALLDAPEWPRGPARAWLFRRVRFSCLDVHKRRKSAHVAGGGLFGELELTSPRTGPRTAVLRQEAVEALRAHVAALPDHHAEVLVLRFFEGMEPAEIAEVLGLTRSVVKSRLYEASCRLRSALRERP